MEDECVVLEMNSFGAGDDYLALETNAFCAGDEHFTLVLETGGTKL